MDTHEYATLSPDTIADAIESLGYVCDLRNYALNSYENRVYQVGIEDEEPIIAKFYRPNRWSNDQIFEEHQFCFELQALEVPIVAPLKVANQSLFEYQDFRFALYPRRGGHAPDLDDLDCLYTLGQHIGRIHELGKVKPFAFRPQIDLDTFVTKSRQYILENQFVPKDLLPAYESITTQLIAKLDSMFSNTPYQTIRLHGDCHPGNILSRPDSLYLVDLDDARNGPAIQDIWMLVSGDENQMRAQLSAILEGYQEFCDFNLRELNLIEPLRTFRLIHYAGWLAKRWHDPAFPLAFPWFNTERYWAEHILELKEQHSALDAAPIGLQL